MASYTVKKGDSWWKIAEEQLGSGAKYADLAKYNNMDVKEVIHPGMTISLPGTGTSAKQASAPAGNVSLAASAGNRPQYTPGSAVQDAADALENISQSRPGAYESQYAEQIDAVLDELLNGKRPVYDPSRDPLYAMYRDQYMQSGKAAMQDTMANAAALSGGYGNSYAATAGNEAYQAYLAQLSGIIPELAELAYARYEDELAAKRANLSALSGLEERDYGVWRDTVSDWEAQRDYLASRYDEAYDRDYGAYRDSVSDWEADRDFRYQQEQDALAQQNWAREFAQKTAASSSSSSARGSGKSTSAKGSAASSGTSPWGKMTDAQIKKAKGMRGDIAAAAAYLQDTGGISGKDRLRAALKAIGFSDAQIDAYQSGKDSARGSGGGGPIQNVSQR